MPYPIPAIYDLDCALTEVRHLSLYLNAAHAAAQQLAEGDNKTKIIKSLSGALETSERLFAHIDEAKSKQSSQF